MGSQNGFDPNAIFAKTKHRGTLKKRPNSRNDKIREHGEPSKGRSVEVFARRLQELGPDPLLRLRRGDGSLRRAGAQGAPGPRGNSIGPRARCHLVPFLFFGEGLFY